MKKTITVEELQERSVMIATPMYGAQCFGTYTASIADFASLATSYDIHYGLQFLFSESLIQRARNYLADIFLRSEFTHLLYIDADIQFEAMQILQLLGIADPDSDKDVVCGIYPRKAIFWNNIEKAVKAGVKTEELLDYAASFVFNPIPGTKEFKNTEPLEVAEGATGFMMIQRHVLEKFMDTYPEQSYKPDHHVKGWDGSREIFAFFDCGIDPESKRYLSEDYFFSQKVRKMGSKIWMCPWVALPHTGTYVYKGKLENLSNIEAPLV